MAAPHRRDLTVGGSQPLGVGCAIGQTDPGANPRYWKPWVATVTRWIRAGLRPLVFLRTPDNVVAPRLARDFHAEGAPAAGIEALPPLPALDVESTLFGSGTGAPGTQAPRRGAQ